MADENSTPRPGQLANQTARLFIRAIDQALKPLGIRSGQIPVLLALRNGKELNQRALIEIVGIEQPGMVTLLSRMERDNLIRRTPDAKDKRSVRISLTDEGEEKSARVPEFLEEVNNKALTGFTPLERSILTALLDRIILNLENKE